MKFSTIYILRCNDFYKIGITNNNVEGRIAQLQTGNPYEIKLVKTYKVPSTTESSLHGILKNSGLHERGEWFHLEDAALGIIMKTLEMREQIYQKAMPK